MAPDLNLLGYGGIAAVVGTFSLKFGIDWLKDRTKSRDQAQALWQIERDAHNSTRERLESEIERLESDLESERKSLKVAEMELRQTNLAHDDDRRAWRAERETHYDMMEKLKNEVRTLSTRVNELTELVDRRRNDPT